LLKPLNLDSDAGMAYRQKMKTLPPKIAKIRDEILAVEHGIACSLPTKQPTPEEWQERMKDWGMSPTYTLEESVALDVLIDGLI
jgi:hypothetical protein